MSVQGEADPGTVCLSNPANAGLCRWSGERLDPAAWQWLTGLLRERLCSCCGPPGVRVSYWAWGATDGYGAYLDRVSEAWPVFHRATGKDGLGSVAAGSIAFMCGFRGFMIPARPT